MDKCVIEIRIAGENLHGVIITEGRAAAGGRRELFAPGAAEWPSGGVELLDAHSDEGGKVLAKVWPMRTGNEIQVRTRATPERRAAVDEGKKYMSVEFQALQESTTLGGVREITRALIVRAAMVANPEYKQTSVEIRSKGRKRWLI